MRELTLEAAGMTREEIEALPTRKTWYGIVGTADKYLAPSEITDDAALAKAQAIVHNHQWPTLGPWSVVTLTENLRTPA